MMEKTGLEETGMVDGDRDGWWRRQGWLMEKTGMVDEDRDG